MTHPGKEVIVQDVTKIESSREDLMKQSKIPKPFIFKGYKTEQDRIVNDLIILINSKIQLEIIDIYITFQIPLKKANHPKQKRNPL